MAHAAERWRRCNEEAENVIAQFAPSRYIEIRYEQLCTDTDATLNQIFLFLGVNSLLAIKDFKNVRQHVVGNGMRLDTSSKIRLDERWRSVLTEEELSIFGRKAGKMNRSYGYK
jgi:hypothetical protein